MINLKNIRKIIKDLHKDRSFNNSNSSGVWSKLPNDWINHTFTTQLYTNSIIYNSLVDLLASLTNSDPHEFVLAIRREITKYIKELSNENFGDILVAFRKNNPQYKTKTKQGMCKIIKETMADFDDCLLPFVSRILNLDFIFFNTTDNDSSSSSLVNNTHPEFIHDSLLLVEFTKNGSKWNLVGFNDKNSFQSIFSRKSIPKTIDNFVDKHNYILGLVKITFQVNESINIITLYDNLKLALGIEYFTRDLSQLVNKITAVFLDNLEYKQSINTTNLSKNTNSDSGAIQNSHDST
jgi:hypothetical protein